MHPLQAHILKHLTFTATARYAALKPAGIESNKFAYHLHRLDEESYLQKDYGGYRLTAKGKRYVDKLSLKTFYPRFQPKIVTLIICQNKAGQYLLYKRGHQPFLGLYNFPYGKLHFGEKLQQAAARELKEKGGLVARLRHCGNAYVIIREKGEVVSHMLCHIFLGSHPEGKLASPTEIGQCEWKKLEQMTRREIAPGFLAIYKLAQTKKDFFEEILI